MNERELVKKAIQNFCIREYGSDADFSEGKFQIVYTTMGDMEEYSVDVYADIDNLEITTYRDGIPAYRTKYRTHADMAMDIDSCNFDDMIRWWDCGVIYNWIVFPYSPNHKRMPGVVWAFEFGQTAARFVEEKKGVYKDPYGFEWKLKIEYVGG